MVLAELGNKICGALTKMTNSVVIDEKVLDELLKTIGTALMLADVDVHLVKKLQTNIRTTVNLQGEAAGTNKRKLIHQTVFKEMIALLDSGGKPYKLKKGKPNVIMFVGLQGAGKTTSVTKYAYHYKKKGWKTALICADTFRAGAFDQLKQNATKAKIPFYGSYTEQDPVVTAEAGVRQFREEKFEVIIVDTSGRHKQEASLFEEMKELERVVKPDDVVFVMDSSIGQAAKSQALAFRETVAVGSVVITKLDGHAKGGGALSAVAATNSPIIFVGTGEHMDDWEEFDSKSFTSRLLGMGDLQGLQKILEKNNIFNSDSQKELLNKITTGSGQFTFRDMYEQFQNLLKLGPLGQVMSMIPGMNGVLGSKGKEDESKARIKRFMTIMDSMTNEELDSSDDIFKQPSRIMRVARGAGVRPEYVHEVLVTFKPFKKVGEKMKEMSKQGLLDPSKMSGRNSAANARQIASMFDPRLVQKLGGVQNLQKMMTMGMPGMGGPGGDGMGGGMGGEGGMPDMGAMMQMMQNMRGGLGGMPGMGGMGRGAGRGRRGRR